MIGWDMILTHELQDNIAYTVIPGFTDEADVYSHSSQWDDAVEYRASRYGGRRLVTSKDDIEDGLSDTDYFSHSDLDFSPR